MQKQTYDLIVFGGVCCDIVMSGVQRLPNPGEEIWAKSMKLTVGGSFNVAAAAARLGMKTALPCVIGNDMLSEFILTTAEQEGIDTRLFQQKQEPCEQLSVVLNFGSDRAFVSYSANAAEKELEALINVIPDLVKAKTAVFGMSDKPLYQKIMQKMAKEGTAIVLDCSWNEEILKSNELKEQIRCCDYFLPNLVEAQCITGKSEPEEAARELARLAKHVVVKLGAEGAVYVHGDTVKWYPAVDFGKVIDTTGAGDNFAAGMCYGLINSESVDKCILYGLLCGSKSVLAEGGFTASMYESELKEISKAQQRLEAIS